MKLEKSVERQTKNTIEYYKNLDNIEEIPIDILRTMYKDLLQELQENSIPKKKIEDILKDTQEEYELLLEHQSGKESNRTKYLRGKIHLAQELLEDK